MRNYWIAAIVLFVLVGTGGWYFMQNQAPQTTETNPTAQPTASTTEISADSSTPSATQAAVKEFTIAGSSFKFEPNEIKVNKGDTVKITFKNSGGFHDLKIPDFNASTKQIQSGSEETIQFVADKVGTFEYFCSVGNHKGMGMKGNLIVQ